MLAIIHRLMLNILMTIIPVNGVSFSMFHMGIKFFAINLPSQPLPWVSYLFHHEGQALFYSLTV